MKILAFLCEIMISKFIRLFSSKSIKKSVFFNKNVISSVVVS